MNWPDTRQQSHLDTSLVSMAAWVLRALLVISNLTPVPLRCGRVLFSVADGKLSISVRTSAWFFNRWEQVFYFDHWVGFVPDDVRLVVCDQVWQLVREAEQVDRERMRGGRQ